MTTELPEDPLALKNLVYSQRQEIATLTEKLQALSSSYSSSASDLPPPGSTVSERTRKLYDVERDSLHLNVALQQQLNEARAKNAEIQASFAEPNLKVMEDCSNLPDDPVLLKNRIREYVTALAQRDATIRKLKFDLEMEAGHVNILRHDIQALKKMSVDLHSATEQEEENISNRLLKRISGLKEEKGNLLREVEQEEEFITNSLAKKLRQLQKEKVDLENALEQEQEFLVNRLQKQLDALRMQQQPQNSPPVSVSSTKEGFFPISSPSPTHAKWIPSHSPSASDLGAPSPGVIEMLKAEVNALRSRLHEVEKGYLSQHNKCMAYKGELINLRKAAGKDIQDLMQEESLPPFMKSSNSPTSSRKTLSGAASPCSIRSRSVSCEFRGPAYNSGHGDTSALTGRSPSVTSFQRESQPLSGTLPNSRPCVSTSAQSNPSEGKQ